MNKENFLRVGVITQTHGIRGEVKVFPTTEDVERFRKLDRAFIDGRRGKTEVHVASVKFFKQYVILKFKEFDNINDIECFVKNDLLVAREDAIECAPGEYFICDLVGLKVVTDDGKELGILEDVMETGANNVYIVKMEDGKEVLIPVIDDCIIGHDMDAGIITVHLLPGLL